MASAVAQPYNNDLGAKPPVGFRGRAKPLVSESEGQNPSEAEALVVFGRSMKAANLPTFLKFGNAKISDICMLYLPK